MNNASESRKIAREILEERHGKNGHAPTNGIPPNIAAFNQTDMGNAERFIRDHGENVRYCYPWGKWLIWNGIRWERDPGDRAHGLAKETVRGIYHEAAAATDEDRRKALAKHATRSEAAEKIRAMLELARSDVPIAPEYLDADPWLLNVENGIVDLRTGDLRPHRREHLMTKLAAVEYEYDATAPKFQAFLEEVLPSESLRAFVQRGAGYSATGDTSEQCLFINHGGGNNGKSTFQEVIGEALGDYASRTPTETLMVKRSGGVPNDVARLKGQRFVAASETEEGKRLAESLIKDLTGQDTVSARFMRAEWFDFKPTHKIWLSTNHKPEIRGMDNAIWRRIRLIPWGVTVPKQERDRKLPEKLRGELPGVLAWIVRGCLEWQSQGLKEPDEVRQATAAYRGEMDTLAAFIADECVLGDHARVAATPLYDAYRKWCEENGERSETQRSFGTRLGERGFVRERIKQGPYKGRMEWLGIGLRVNEHPPDNGGGGGENGSESFDEGSPGERTPDNGSLDVSGLDIDNAANEKTSSERSEPQNDISSSEIHPRGVMCEKGSLRSLRSLEDENRNAVALQMLREIPQLVALAEQFFDAGAEENEDRIEAIARSLAVRGGGDWRDW